MRDVRHAVATLERLRSLGVVVSIDDFGTGHSSLSQIKRLPLDELKIDRSFVVDLPRADADTAIVGSTIELGHSLSLRIVAEGVETEEALAWLEAQGCDEVQGYYVSRPLAEDRFIAWVREHAEGARLPATMGSAS